MSKKIFQDIDVEVAGEKTNLLEMLYKASNGYYSFYHWQKIAEMLLDEINKEIR
jgi:hypothetical protein